MKKALAVIITIVLVVVAIYLIVDKYQKLSNPFPDMQPQPGQAIEGVATPAPSPTAAQ
ncbi:MAG: hypothetical protein M1457_13665 [bacterium]|nr:hypothetical protein [bacterium]